MASSMRGYSTLRIVTGGRAGAELGIARATQGAGAKLGYRFLKDTVDNLPKAMTAMTAMSNLSRPCTWGDGNMSLFIALMPFRLMS